MNANGRLILIACFFVFFLAPLRGADPEILRIGFVQSISEEGSPARRELFASEFRSLVFDLTGLKSVVLEGVDPFTAAGQLDAQKWNLGVFHGVEFAWVQSKFPKLRPLMIAATKAPADIVYVFVKKENAVAQFSELKGKDITFLQSKLDCRLFADKAAGGSAQNFFGKIYQTRSGEDALDDVLRGKVEAAIVDTPAMLAYKEIQPGRFANLKIAAKSEPFPPSVIVYRQGSLSDPMLKKISDGMRKANQTAKGREAMSSFGVTDFQPIPSDYQQSLTAISKEYPPPR